MFGSRRTPSARPSFLMFRIDRPIGTDKFISCVAPCPSQCFFHFGEELVISRTQEKTTTLGNTESHHFSWQCKESYHLLSRNTCTAYNGRFWYILRTHPIFGSSRFGFYDAQPLRSLASLPTVSVKSPTNFFSEDLILAWDSFTCRKSTTRDLRLYFPSEGSHTQDFYALRKSIDPGRVWTREPRFQWRVWDLCVQL